MDAPRAQTALRDLEARPSPSRMFDGGTRTSSSEISM